MAYLWESERVILVSVPSDKIKKGAIIPAEWQQKLVCRACGGSGCKICAELGYLTKKKTQSVQVQETLANGSWIRFRGAGDERPDLGGYGDAVIQIHIAGMEEPSSLPPEMGSTVGLDSFGFEDIFSSFFGSNFSEFSVMPCINESITITRQEAREGCRAYITIPVTSICGICKGSGLNPAAPQYSCDPCKGSGHVSNMQTLPVLVPPNTKNKEVIMLSKAGDTKLYNGEIRTSDVAVKVKIRRFLF